MADASAAHGASGASETHERAGVAGAGAPLVTEVLTRPNVGGATRAVMGLASGLGSGLAGGFEVRVVAGRAPDGEGELHAPGIVVQRVPLVRPIRPAHDLAALVRLRGALAGSALVHTHMAKAGALGRLAAASIRPRPVVVHTYHGHVLEGYFGRSATAAFLAAERLLAKVSDALVAVSPEVRDSLLEMGVGRPEDWHVIELGVDTEALGAVPPLGERSAPGELRRRIGLGAGEVLIGVTGRLVPVKDHATLFAAMAGLGDRHMGDWHLAVLGDGELEGELRALAHQLGIGDRVHFLGWWRDMPAALADLDLVVLTSVSEGTPMALIEAAAAGRPVVATDVGGVRTVVEQGVSGLLVPARSPDDLAGAIRRLASDRALAASMGEAARRAATARFGIDRFVAAHAQLYASLLDDRRGHPD